MIEACIRAGVEANRAKGKGGTYTVKDHTILEINCMGTVCRIKTRRDIQRKGKGRQDS